jgi:predicted SprT family Zn-dependent metalloprotease
MGWTYHPSTDNHAADIDVARRAVRYSAAAQRLPGSRRVPPAPDDGSPDQTWARLAAGLNSVWGVPDLEIRVRVQVSHRLRVSLGRSLPAKGVIRIAAFLLDGPHPLLREVLAHEAAHVAVHILHGKRVRPHGPEWRSLMRRAALEPRLRVPIDEIDVGAPMTSPRRRTWEHRCPVCHVRRVAARPVRRWRCAACRAAGLEGELVIRRVDRREVRIG